MTPPFDIADRKQLFIDERFVTAPEKVCLRVNPPVKAGPIDLDAETSGMVGIAPHQGRYWMYYRVNHGEEGGFGVALSEDGVTWRRPQGDSGFGPERSIPLPGVDSGLVCVAPKESEHPFKGLFDVRRAQEWGLDPAEFGDVPATGATQATARGGLLLFRSADGLQWERVKGLPVPFLCDTQNQLLYDPRIDRYVAYLRAFPTLDGPHRNKRCVVRAEMSDLYEMPWPHTPNAANRAQPPHDYPYINDEMSIVMAADEEDPSATDLYGPNVELYPGAQDVYLAFPAMYRTWGYSGQNISHGRDHRGTISNDGLFETHLAVSRDGVQWHRYRTPYVSAGRLLDREGHEGDPDCGLISMAVGTVCQGDEVWQYYYGAQRTHLSVEHGEQLGLTRSAVFRLVQRLDGFVSVDADHGGGHFTTPVLQFTGRRLELNAACHGLGEIGVEIRDADGLPIPGYTLAEAVPIDRNGVAQEVWWHGGPELAQLAGTPVRVHFRMRSASLYAFQFVDD